MANSSLAYEILLYLNSFYFGMFAPCQVGAVTLKMINFAPKAWELTPHQWRDIYVLAAVIIVETVRVVLGRRGSLSDRGWQVITSVVLTIPCVMGIYYLLMLQHITLKLERILCALMLALQVTELVYASMFIVTTCRPQTYY